MKKIVASGDYLYILGVALPKWWNWQTRCVQGAVSVRTCGFKSHLRHKSSPPERRVRGLFLLPAPVDIEPSDCESRIGLTVSKDHPGVRKRRVSPTDDSRTPSFLTGGTEIIGACTSTICDRPETSKQASTRASGLAQKKVPAGSRDWSSGKRSIFILDRAHIGRFGAFATLSRFILDFLAVA